MPRSRCKWPIFAWKFEICLKFPEKSIFFLEICLKNRNFLVKLPEKIEIFRKFACQNRNSFPGSTTPQISNRIDGADVRGVHPRREVMHSPYLGEFIYLLFALLIFLHFPLISFNLRVFSYFTFFAFPYFDHNAFIRYTMHVGLLSDDIFQL